jgi:hypothetical protein
MEPRSDFQLPEEERTLLSSGSLNWECIVEAGVNWLIVRQHPVVDGYNVAVVDLALRIPPSYPDEQIDMVYFHPPLQLIDKRPIPNLSTLTIESKAYQQWSRHRTTVNPWRPGIDSVGTHLLQVNSWLTRELERKSA